MFKRSTIVALAFVVVGVTAAGQEPATLMLKSGERLAGTLIDLNASGFQIRVDGNERAIAKHEVAIVNFAGELKVRQSDLDKMSGQHVFVLRNGDVVRGDFYDIGGTHPLRLTVKTDSGEREFTSNDVSYIVLARPPDSAIVHHPAPGTPSGTPAGEGTLVRVAANQEWVATGITVQQGQAVAFTTGGEVRLNSTGDLVARPAGVADNRDPKSPLRDVPVGALIGRIGPAASGGVFGRRVSAPFLIGDQNRVVMPAGGQLYLGVNDSVHTDNSGTFEVRVNVNPNTRR